MTIALTLGLATCVVGLSQASATASTAPTVSAHFAIVAPGASAQLVSDKQLPGGDYTDTWKVGGVSVTVAGPQGSTVYVTQTTKSAEVRVTPPARTFNNVQDARAATSEYLASGKSVEQDASAVGFTPTQMSAFQKSKPNVVTPDFPIGGVIATPCFSVTGDSLHAWTKLCDRQIWGESISNGIYVSDQVEGSGSDNNPAEYMKSIGGGVYYPSANEGIVQWSPTATVEYNTCGVTKTFTVNVPGLGSYSSSSTDCPGSLEPTGLPSEHAFGSQFNTCDTGMQVDGFASTDVAFEDWGAQVTPQLTAMVAWGC